MVEVYGNKTGLAPSAVRALERIYRRRVPSDRIVTPELVRSLADASRETGRQVGALVHRSGEVDYVIVGNATSLMLPDIGRLRAAEGRFRALRLVHTHLFGEPLTRDDLVDLTRLRLDLVAAILLTPEGDPRSLTWAYNVPARDEQLSGGGHNQLGTEPSLRGGRALSVRPPGAELRAADRLARGRVRAETPRSLDRQGRPRDPGSRR